MVTGVDIVKAQIRIAEGGRLGVADETGVPPQSEIHLNGHALQCRITTEDPENNFIPDYGRITAYRGAFGYGVRVRSEEHTSELQSLMRISYAVFCLKKK